MSLDFIKFAFSAGEISPTLKGRTDLENYDLGLDLARNWFVDYRGGLTTRPGTTFLDYIMHDDEPIRFVEFKYAPDIANTYLLIFGHNYVRFVQDGAYVLETGTGISGITQASPGVVTSVGHGLAEFDWVRISGVAGMTEVNNRTFMAVNVTADTFELYNPHSSTGVSTVGYTAYSAGPFDTVSRIYTVVTPYAGSDLAGLSFAQYRDMIRITSLSFAPRELIRNDAADWDLNETVFGSEMPYPTISAVDMTGAGTYDTVFAVSASDINGEESLPSPVVPIEDHASMGEGDAVSVFWTPVANAYSYTVYGSNENKGNSLTRGAQLGYLGRTFGTSFEDRNIIPDFTKTPPQYNNPFAHGAIETISITNVGSGYGRFDTTVAVAGGTGSGFRGEAIVSLLGTIEGVKIINPGAGYTSPVVTFTGTGAATGATATATATELTGNYPAKSAVFQQRQLFASTLNKPLTIFGSKPKQFNNFDVSDIVADNDSYEFELDSEEVAPIRHIKPVRGGLLLMTNSGIWLMTGGGQNDPITPTNVLANINTYRGISNVPPITMDTDLLYIESKGFTARLLEYNDFARVFSGSDISIFSNHFFSSSNYITEWTFADDPFKLVWARRQDGALLALTAVKEQKVFAWTQHWTKGYFENVLTVREGDVDTVYLAVRRYINGRSTLFLEKFATKDFDHVEDAICVDCGLSLGRSAKTEELQTTRVDEDTVTITSPSPAFLPGWVGAVIRAGGAKIEITAFNSIFSVTGLVLREFTEVLPEDPDGAIPSIYSWTIAFPITSIGGLWHLEGETLVANADGNVVTDLVVTNGEITLPNGVTSVHAGIPYTCKARTLPLTASDAVIEGRRKRVVGVAPRVHETRGLKAGTKLEKLYPMRERTNEIPGEPNEAQSGVKHIIHQSLWDNDGQVYLVQEYPLPASIIGFVTSTELGDDPDPPNGGSF